MRVEMHSTKCPRLPGGVACHARAVTDDHRPEPTQRRVQPPTGSLSPDRHAVVRARLPLSLVPARKRDGIRLESTLRNRPRERVARVCQNLSKHRPKAARYSGSRAARTARWRCGATTRAPANASPSCAWVPWPTLTRCRRISMVSLPAGNPGGNGSPTYRRCRSITIAELLARGQPAPTCPDNRNACSRIGYTPPGGMSGGFSNGARAIGHVRNDGRQEAQPQSAAHSAPRLHR